MDFYRVLMFPSKTGMATKVWGIFARFPYFKMYYFVPTPQLNKSILRNVKEVENVKVI